MIGAALVIAACGGSARDALAPAASPAASAPGSSAPDSSGSASASLPAPPIASILASASAGPAPDLTARLAPPTLRKTPFIGLTVSGGVSLGAYEAGYLYYITEVAKLPGNSKAIDLKLVTGASAGNINALLAILSLCRKPEPNPQRSLFWNTWIRIGAGELFRPPSPSDPPEKGQGAFSRAALLRIAGSLEDAWAEGIDDKCDKVLAVSTTRLKSAEVSLQDGFKVPRLEEKFVVRIKGRGPGSAPQVSNYVDPRDALPRPMLPFPTDQSLPDAQLKTFAMVRDLLLASAAFPVAFPPQPLPHCLTPGRRNHHRPPNAPPASSGGPPPGLFQPRPGVSTDCGDLPVFTEEFIDGGVFDNTPLRLAQHLTAYLDPSGEWRNPRIPAPPAASPYAGGFLFIDPDTAAYPAPTEAAASYALPLIPQLGSFLSNFIATARSKELYTLLQEQPDLDVVLARRNFPTASGHLANFFGFFEESFRRFDFYLGMYDAHRMALQTLPEVLDVSRPQTVEAVWDPFVCMASVFSDKDLDQRACRPDPLRCAAVSPADCQRKTRHAAAFRVLLQVAIDRLYSHCEELPPAMMPTVEHSHCLRAMLHKPRRTVDRLPQGNDPGHFRRRASESHFEHTLRLLDHYRFRFEDLLGVGSSGNSQEAMTRVRLQLAQVIERMAGTQPFADALVLRMLGKPALNFIYYAPPPTIAYASIGRGIEAGGSWLINLRRLRFNAALQMKGLEEVLFSDEGEAAFTPLVGVEAEFYGSAIAQARLGLRAGFQMSTKGLRASDCRNPSSKGLSFSVSRSDCSSLVAQLPLSVAIFERVRFQLVPEYLIPHSPLDGKSWNILFGVGGQLISPFF